MEKDNRFSRSELLWGKDAIEGLSKKRIAVFGLGGVGGYAALSMARAGIGMMDIFDADTVGLTDINRQIIASDSTVGEKKTDVAERMIKDINPKCDVKKHFMFVDEENIDSIDFSVYDYVLDCIDTVKTKLALAEKCAKAGVPFISSMGAGNKRRTDCIKIDSIYKTSVCPLAKVIRTGARKASLPSFDAIYSTESPSMAKGADAREAAEEEKKDKDIRKNMICSSGPFVPPAFGLAMAAYVTEKLIGEDDER